MNEPDRATARSLAAQSLAAGDAIGWFETLYELAAGDPSRIPWADLRINPNLADWLASRRLDGHGRRALVVGCGLGDDAEELARLGFLVAAFDVSPTAITWCRRRFTESSVDYQVADLLQPPAAWHEQFDLVVEIYTLQVLPTAERQQAAHALVGCLAPGGTLLVVARGREPHEGPGAMPWPLLRSELETLTAPDCQLELVMFEDYLDTEQPPVRRFRVEYRRR